MSLRDRFRQGAPQQPPDPNAEARAAQALAAKRGRPSYGAPPKASKAVTALLRPLLANAGLGLAELRRRWDEVAGAPFAGKSSPEKLTGGVLTLRAPSALAPFLQQQAPLLLERLRLAGASVKSIRIEQRATAPARGPNVRPLKKAIDAAEENALASSFDHVRDPGLRSALMRLGRAMKQG